MSRVTAQPAFDYQLERAVWRAFHEIPPEFRSQVTNLDFVIEPEPPSGQNWLASYEGTPLTEQTVRQPGWPSRITFYSGAFKRLCGDDPQCLEDELRRTVRHELAHYFGISDERLRELDAY